MGECSPPHGWRCTYHKECHTDDNQEEGGWCVTRAVDEISADESISPIIRGVLEEVAQWHGAISKAMDEHGFVFSLEVMEHKACERQAR